MPTNSRDRNERSSQSLDGKNVFSNQLVCAQRKLPKMMANNTIFHTVFRQILAARGIIAQVPSNLRHLKQYRVVGPDITKSILGFQVQSPAEVLVLVQRWPLPRKHSLDDMKCFVEGNRNDPRRMHYATRQQVINRRLIIESRPDMGFATWHRSSNCFQRLKQKP